MTTQEDKGYLAVAETKGVQARDDGGDAFPTPSYSSSAGMTLRDYFAAKAAQGMLTTSGAPSLGGLDGYEDRFAAAAYKIADAMLKARLA